MTTLRQLLIQRAARLQERPAVTAPDWGTLAWGAWRNRVEGVGLGLLATPRPVGAAVHATTGTPWDWAAEVAAACCGLVWDAAGEVVPAEVLGGPAFNADPGRGPFHDREDAVTPATPFTPGLDHATLLQRLQRLNRKLGWDHGTTLTLALGDLGHPEARAALWSVLYAGGHAVLRGPETAPQGLGRWFGKRTEGSTDLSPFEGFWD